MSSLIGWAWIWCCFKGVSGGAHYVFKTYMNHDVSENEIRQPWKGHLERFRLNAADHEI